MPAKFLAIALVSAASAAHLPAFSQLRAGDGAASASAASSSVRVTRAEVQAEVVQARRDGTLPSHGEHAGIGRPAVTTTANVPRISRDEVRAAYLQAARAGTSPSYDEGDDMGRAAVADPSAVQRTRADVRAEALHAVRNGLTVGGEV